MYDPENSAAPPIDLSTDGRMALGIIQPWGNCTYLAAEMGGVEPVQDWRSDLPAAKFPCPLCAGHAVARSQPTVGLMTVACEKNCDPAQLRAACQAKAPLAFEYCADLIPPVPQVMIDVIAERLATGALDQNSHAALGTTEAKKILTAVDRLRCKSSATCIDRLTNEQGGTIGLVLRGEQGDAPEKAKAFLYVHTVRTADGHLEARLGLFERLWPLVGRHLLTAASKRAVIVAEGEKARAKAAELLPDYDCVTSVCGASNAHCTDWSALTGREVIIMRDNDEAGLGYAHAVAAHAISAGAVTVRLMEVLEGTPVGGDIGDGLPDDRTVADLRTLIGAAPQLQWETVKNALRRDRSAQEWPPFRLPDGHLKGRKHVVHAIGDALGHIDPGCRRVPWLGVLCCLHNALGVDGIPLAVAWSKRDNDKHGKFREGEVERLFEFWSVNPVPEPMSVVQLFWRAWRESEAASNSDEGWRPAPDVQAEAELAAFESKHRKLRQGDNIVVGTQTRGADGTYTVEYLREETVRSMYKAHKVPGFDVKKGNVSIVNLWKTIAAWARGA